jgi:DNA-directed RNA polymerase specialized sigma subunit
LIAVGNFALTRAATRYRPSENEGTPFSAYARAAIAGAIKDTFRRSKFAEQTMPPLDNVIEFPAQKALSETEERIDLGRRFAQLRAHITACLTPLQASVIDLYYSPALPDLPTVAEMLGITRNMAFKAHSTAIRTLRDRLREAA